MTNVPVRCKVHTSGYPAGTCWWLLGLMLGYVRLLVWCNGLLLLCLVAAWQLHCAWCYALHHAVGSSCSGDYINQADGHAVMVVSFVSSVVNGIVLTVSLSAACPCKYNDSWVVYLTLKAIDSYGDLILDNRLKQTGLRQAQLNWAIRKNLFTYGIKIAIFVIHGSICTTFAVAE